MLSSEVSGCPETSFQNYWNLSKDSCAIWSGFNASEIWRFSIPQPMPTIHPKVWWGSESKKWNTYQLQIMQTWFCFLHWIKQKSVTLEVQRAMQIRPFSGFAKSYINETVYPFSLAVSPELMSSFPCSWNLPTEINLAALRSAYPVWFGRQKDNLTWKISNCLWGAEGG